MNLISRQKIRIYYYVAGVAAMVFMSAFMSIPYFLNMKKQHQIKIEQLANSIVSEKKRHLADIINRTIVEIDLTRKDVLKEYSNICIEFCTTLSSVYFEKNAGQSDATHLVQMKSNQYLSAQNASLKVSFVVYDRGNKRVIYSSGDMDAEIFTENIMSSINDRKLFPSIATGISREGFDVYVFIARNKIESIAMNRMKDLVRAVRLGDDGYIWINQIVNYDGGDDYAIRLVHPNLPLTEGVKLSTKTEDAHGNFPYKEELDGVKRDGDLYFDYYFKKMNVDQVSHKLTYAKLYKPYDWVLATGVYLDDVDLLVQSEQSIMDDTYNSQLRIFGFLVFSMFSISALFLVVFEMQINELINSYISTIDESGEALRLEKDNVVKAYDQLKSVAYLDYLTNLWNRRAMYGRIIEESSRCLRKNSKFVVIIADIDHFKQINDTYGHDSGDLVLKQLSELMKNNIRIEDSISRWGGEEFLILGTSCDISAGVALAEKIRSAVENLDISLNSTIVKLTMTFGVAEFNKDKSIDETIKEADFYLYRGKQGTRNCVISSMSLT